MKLLNVVGLGLLSVLVHEVVHLIQIAVTDFTLVGYGFGWGRILSDEPLFYWIVEGRGNTLFYEMQAYFIQFLFLPFSWLVIRNGGNK